MHNESDLEFFRLFPNLDLAPIHEKRLLKLATYLDNSVSQEQFDMGIYRSWDAAKKYKVKDKRHTSSKKVFNDPNLCGTVGCALGYAPIATGIYPKYNFSLSLITIASSINWLKYALETLGLNNYPYDFLFHQKWASIDNTPKGAAARIRFLVDNQDTLKSDATYHNIRIYSQLIYDVDYSKYLDPSYTKSTDS